MAVAPKGCKDYQGDGEMDPQWVYGLELVEDQLDPNGD